ncbi:hypothetical protein T492DRAFT_6882 [Pavlovales sp. CCMP2436]|nr:hypothetical protein T492DRAFT_6882 [Pavlovales sp. CCMP2436]
MAPSARGSLSAHSLDRGLPAGRSSATTTARGGSMPTALSTTTERDALRRTSENRAPRATEGSSAERTVHGLRSRLAEMERDYVLVVKRCAILETQLSERTAELERANLQRDAALTDPFHRGGSGMSGMVDVSMRGGAVYEPTAELVAVLRAAAIRYVTYSYQICHIHPMCCAPRRSGTSHTPIRYVT